MWGTADNAGECAMSSGEEIPTESEDTIIPTESEDTIIPTESEDTIIPTESEDTIVPTESEDTIVPTESEDTIVPTESEDTIVPTESEDTVVPTESDTELDLDNEVAEMFRQIWEDLHYGDDMDPDQLSRTLYQVDQSLDYIEEILGQFHDVMLNNDLITQ
jgi:hypothetical protein